MPLSSNTIIHFTATKDALMGILADNFQIRFCKETIRWTKKHKAIIQVPMVSFCDIPLSEIKDHISKYGHYGIGLSRKWAIKNKLNPVLYIEPDSNLANSFRKIILHFAKSPDLVKNNRELTRPVLDIIRYVKNYEADLTRGGKTTQNYRFSDEREWRYSPDYDPPAKLFYMDKAFSDGTTKKKAHKEISELRLEFEPNDVKYIIIKNDDEISDFIAHLRKAKGKKYTQDDIERLSTRLLTSEQIHHDI